MVILYHSHSIFQRTCKAVRKYFQCFKPRKSEALKVLLVDDSNVVHMSLTRRLKTLNWTLVSAHGGRQAIELFNKTCFQGIDMVLMDLCMPVMDGRTTIKMLIDRGCKTPIFVLTATTGEVVVPGALGVLRKPLKVPAVVEVLLRAHKKNQFAEVVRRCVMTCLDGSSVQM